MTLRIGITEELKSQIWSRSAVLLQNPFSLTVSNSMLILASDTTFQETGSCAVGLHSSCWGQSCRKSFNHLFLFRGMASKGRQNSSSKDPSTLLIINAHFSVLILLLHSYPCLLSPTHNSAWEVRFCFKSVITLLSPVLGLPMILLNFLTDIFHNYLNTVNSRLDHLAPLQSLFPAAWALSKYTITVSNLTWSWWIIFTITTHLP